MQLLPTILVPFVLSTLCLFSPSSLLWLLKIFRSICYSEPPHNYSRLLRDIKNVLDPPRAPGMIAILLQERADSNKRLIRALNISNTFVSSEVAVHEQFVRQARHLLNNVKGRGWQSFQSTTFDAVRWQLEQDPSIEIPFDRFIQNITLVVVLLEILQVENPVEALSYDDITLIANHITTLWSLSKKSDPIPPDLLPALQAALRRIVINKNLFPDPLNFVVPAWETLWRVVATTVAYSFARTDYKESFQHFSAYPSERRFARASMMPGETVSVQAIVSEAMRLHPPSKHIGRVRCRSWCPEFFRKWLARPGWIFRKKSADIQKILRCHEIWGSDSDTFDPSRCQEFAGREEEQSAALGLVFGHGPLKCIASSWAPVAAAVISGAILEQFNESMGHTLQVGAEIGGRTGWIGWSVIRKED
ncbi:hypothetical protein D9613_003414 [Agrocybe pediades]|uniref:Cytochrome P450 n=1 Tax=Agrocybe pediades TaxID=84607 RepID=A0A8H4QQL9_9AGAR|nr:hypothetical protein D9613_003414 [Agrocybe pediades]